MDEPTLAEEVRRLAEEVRRLVDSQRSYVTKEIMDLRLESLQKDTNLRMGALQENQMEDRARLDAMSRWVFTAVLGPVIVGVILYLLVGKSP